MKNLLTILVLCSAAASVYSQTCDARYKKDATCAAGAVCSTMDCLPEVACTGATNEICGRTPEDQKQIILNAHNQLRVKITKGEETRGMPGPQKPAYGIHELKWDDDLEAMAFRLASQQVWDHDCNQCRKSDANPSQGQNNFIRAAWPSYPIDWNFTVNYWYDEVKYYDGQNNNDVVNMAGHYTQVVWGATTKVGCAAFRNLNNCSWRKDAWSGYTCIMYVCNYAVGGNTAGSKPYSYDAANDCTERSSTYSELCKS